MVDFPFSLSIGRDENSQVAGLFASDWTPIPVSGFLLFALQTNIRILRLSHT